MIHLIFIEDCNNHKIKFFSKFDNHQKSFFIFSNKRYQIKSLTSYICLFEIKLHFFEVVYKILFIFYSKLNYKVIQKLSYFN